MRNLFNPDNALFQFLSRLCDLVILNVLFIVCSIPIFTIGASLCALHKVMQEQVYEVEGSIIKRFFRAFKSNFKQGTILWLITMVIITALYCDFLLILTYFTGAMATVLYVLLAVLAVLVTGTLGYMFPLLVRYTNSLREHLFNALILSICKLPRTLGIWAMILLPILLAIFAPMTFVRTIIFWLIIGFSFECLMTAHLLKPVFDELESENAQ